jgi:hypothetical protein
VHPPVQALKVTLHGECPSASGLLDRLLPPLRRLTLLDLGPLIGTPRGLARDLWRYVDNLPSWAQQRPAGTPGRPFLRLVMSVCADGEDEGNEDFPSGGCIQHGHWTLRPWPKTVKVPRVCPPSCT